MFAQNRVLARAATLSAMTVVMLAGSSLTLAQVSGVAGPANAGAPAAAPAPAVATNSIIVLAVSGKVQFKSGSGDNLAELRAGQRLLEGAEIFTGLNSIAQIKIGEGQVFTIDRISRVLIKDAVRAANGKGTSLLQLPYGRIRFDVTSTKVANDVKIQTPDATLAVKGTHGVIEKIPGQPTRAYGGELNAGIVNVMYLGGVNVDVKRDGASSGEHPQSAESADAGTYVQTGDQRSADETSRQSAGWTSSLGSQHEQDGRTASGRFLKQFFPPQVIPQGGTPLGSHQYAAVDRRQGATVRYFDTNDSPWTSVASGLRGFFGTPQGAALVNTESGPAIVAIDDHAGPGYASGTMAVRQWNAGLKRWALLGTLSPLMIWEPGNSGGENYGGSEGHFVESAYSFDGLGNLAGGLYASGINPALSEITTGNFGIFSLTYPSLRGGSFQAQQQMSFPMLSGGGGLTGANSRGTMFVTAQFNLSTGAVPGMVLLEVDPRNNYIANAWSVADGDFAAASGGAGIGNSFVPTGLAFVDGQVVVTGASAGEQATFTVRPSESGRGLQPVTTARYGPDAAAANGLAGEGGFNGSASFPLAAPDRKMTAIPGIDPLWLSTSYSRNVANNPTFRRMMRDSVLSVASNPADCAVSAALNTGLNNAIGDHYNQTSGVNGALSQFFGSLPPGHPCTTNIPRGFGR